MRRAPLTPGGGGVRRVSARAGDRSAPAPRCGAERGPGRRCAGRSRARRPRRRAGRRRAACPARRRGGAASARPPRRAPAARSSRPFRARAGRRSCRFPVRPRRGSAHPATAPARLRCRSEGCLPPRCVPPTRRHAPVASGREHEDLVRQLRHDVEVTAGVPYRVTGARALGQHDLLHERRDRRLCRARTARGRGPCRSSRPTPPRRNTAWWACEGRDASSSVLGRLERPPPLRPDGRARGARTPRRRLPASARAAAARSMSNPVTGRGSGTRGRWAVRIDRRCRDDRRRRSAGGIQAHPHDAAVAPAAGDQRAAVGRHGDVADRLPGLDRRAERRRRTRRPSAGTPGQCRRPRGPHRRPRGSGVASARTASRRL